MGRRGRQAEYGSRAPATVAAPHKLLIGRPLGLRAHPSVASLAGFNGSLQRIELMSEAE